MKEGMRICLCLWHLSARVGGGRWREVHTMGKQCFENAAKVVEWYIIVFEEPLTADSFQE